VKHIDKKRVHPIVVVPKKGLLKDRLQDLGVETYVLPQAWWISPTRDFGQKDGAKIDIVERCNNIAALIRDEHVDIVHTNTSVVIEGAIAAKLTERPHIWHLHEILKVYPTLKPCLPLHLIYKFIELHSDVLITVTDALRKAVSEETNTDKIRVIHNGIDVVNECQLVPGFRKEMGISKDYVVVCAIGSVIREKGYDNFIVAAKHVLAKRKNVRFIIIGSMGDHEFASILFREIRRSGLKEYIKFLGHRSDIARILKEIDVCVVSSQTESFGLTQLEAMGAGRPIVATRCGGPEEIVVDGETGILVPINDPEAMAEAIISLADNREKRRQMGLSGLNRYDRYFTANCYCKQIEALYSEVSRRKTLDAEQQKLADSLLELVIDVNREKNAIDARKKSSLKFRRLLRVGYYQAVRRLTGQLPY
jgi:glycosyltransferase involved in cell wall biosynthesis